MRKKNQDIENWRRIMEKQIDKRYGNDGTRVSIGGVINEVPFNKIKKLTIKKTLFGTKTEIEFKK